MKSGERVIIAAHGNFYVRWVKYLDNMSEEEILELNISTGVPLVYEFDENFKPLKRYYLVMLTRDRSESSGGCKPGKASNVIRLMRKPTASRLVANNGAHLPDATLRDLSGLW